MLPRIPIELDIIQTKKEIVESINQIGNSHNIPSVMVIMMLEQILAETRANMLENTLMNNLTQSSEPDQASELDINQEDLEQGD